MKCKSCGEQNPVESVECARCHEPLLDALEAGRTEALGPTVRLGETERLIPPTRVTGSVHQAYTTPTPSPVTGSVTGEFMPHTIFGSRYEILALLGEGGMGRVYMARDLELDRVVALKTIRGAAAPEVVQRFKQELILARRVTHKNVVRIHDLGEAEGVKFFTMEFIEGESLKVVIRRRGPIPPAEAVAMVRQILGALAEAHAQGVIHRDLKPQNIVVDKGGTLYLMDFGIARSMDAAGITATGAIVGTPDYMSPEQVLGRKAETASDIFSFGVILYEMLTGELPYQADTPVSKITMRLSHRPRAPRQIRLDIPKYLENVVFKCLEVDPVLRYQTAAQVLEDLDREQVGRSVTLRAQRAVGRRKGVLATAAALLLAAAVGFAWVQRSRGTKLAPQAEGPLHTLAILPFTNASASKDLEWIRSGLPEMLVTDLSQSRYIRPVPGERLVKVLRDLGMLDQTRFDEAGLESVSRMAPAQSVLYGQFVESEGKLRLDLVLRTAASGVPLPLKVEGSASQLLALVDQIAARVKGQLDLSAEQIRGDAGRPFAEVATSSLEALRAYQAGLARFRQGATQEAIPLLKEATTRDPNFALAYAYLAQACLEAGEVREAEAAIDRARSLSEKAPLPLAERYRIHATAALVKDDYETAVKSYQELAKLFPNDPGVQFSLGGALQELGRFPQAIEAYQRVTQLDPNHGSAVLELARVSYYAGRFKEAIRILEEAQASGRFAKDPEALGTVHSVLGVSYRDTSDLDKSLEHLNLSLEFRRKAGDKKGQVNTLVNLASVYEYRGDVEKALAAERRALAVAREMRMRDRESFVLNNIGLTYKVAGNLDKAIAALRESMQIEMERGDHAELANRLDKMADIYRLKGQYDDALVYLEQARTHLAQTDAKEEKAINLNYIGLVRRAQGLYDQATEAFLAALPLFQEIHQEMGVAMVHHDVAEIYAGQGRYADAHNALRQALDIYQKMHVEHDIAEVKAPLGHLLVALGQLDAAETELGEAEKVAREAKAKGIIPEILLGQAELAHLRGRHEQAARLFEEANLEANLSAQKEVAVESRIELGHLYLDQGKLTAAETLLVRTREEAGRARLRPLEAQAALALAQVHLAKGDPESARKAALDAISLAEKFSGRPVLYQASDTLGQALDRLKREPEAIDAYARAAGTLEWIRGSLRPEHVASFMARHDVQAFLRKTLPRLEKGGRAAEAAPLKAWLGGAATSARAS
jgi:tetratricopeptide (TPR) repeat protein